MNKNKFFEKVGKFTFSIVLTGVLVTSVVAFFTGSWDELDENYLVTGTNWQDTVAEIKSKTTMAEAMTAVINSCKICIAHADFHSTPTNWVCTDFNGGAAHRKLSGGVGADDTISVKVQCEDGRWSDEVLSSTNSACAPDVFAVGAKKNGSCAPGDTNTYKLGGTYCGWDNILGTYYQDRETYTQTCE